MRAGRGRAVRSVCSTGSALSHCHCFSPLHASHRAAGSVFPSLLQRLQQAVPDFPADADCWACARLAGLAACYCHFLLKPSTATTPYPPDWPTSRDAHTEHSGPAGYTWLQSLSAETAELKCCLVTLHSWASLITRRPAGLRSTCPLSPYTTCGLCPAACSSTIPLWRPSLGWPAGRGLGVRRLCTKIALCRRSVQMSTSSTHRDAVSAHPSWAGRVRA